MRRQSRCWSGRKKKGIVEKGSETCQRFAREICKAKGGGEKNEKGRRGEAKVHYSELTQPSGYQFLVSPKVYSSESSYGISKWPTIVPMNKMWSGQSTIRHTRINRGCWNTSLYIRRYKLCKIANSGGLTTSYASSNYFVESGTSIRDHVTW